MSDPPCRPLLQTLSAVLALAALTLFCAAHADGPVPKADPEAEATWSRMDARLSHARTMTFTVTLTGTWPKAAPPLTITGKCEKPNKLALEFRQNGIEIAETFSDGHVQYLYDPQTRQYLRHALGYGPNLTSLVGDFVYASRKGQTSATSTMRLPAHPFGGDASNLLTSLSQVEAYLSFFRYKDPLDPTEPLPPPPPAQTTDMFAGATLNAMAASTECYMSCTHESLDGQAVLHLRGRNVPAPLPGDKHAPPTGYGIDLGSIEWYLDATTDLPRRWTETHTGRYRGSKMLITRWEEDYTSMQAGNTPLPPTTFAWTPPPGARPIHQEKIPPPPMP